MKLLPIGRGLLMYIESDACGIPSKMADRFDEVYGLNAEARK